MYQFVGEAMKNIESTKEIVHRATREIPKGMKKNAISVSVTPRVGILIRNFKRYNFRRTENRKSFEISLYVE